MKLLSKYFADQPFKKSYVDCLKLTGGAAALGAAAGFAATFFMPLAAATAVVAGAAAGGLAASAGIAMIVVVTWPLMFFASMFTRQNDFDQEVKGIFHSTAATGLVSLGALLSVGGIDLLKNPPTPEKNISAAANSAYKCRSTASSVRVTNDAQGRVASINITCQP